MAPRVAVLSASTTQLNRRRRLRLFFSKGFNIKFRRIPLLFFAYALVRLRCSVGGLAVVLGSCLFCAFLIGLNILRLWKRFAAFPRCGDETFQKYVWYRFTIWFGESRWSQLIVLTILVECLCLVSATMYAVVNHASVENGLWQAWCWIVSPDGGAGEALPRARLVGAGTSLGGIVIFALLVSLIIETFSAKMEELKACETPVVESGHTVLLGWTDSSLGLVQELALAAESEGGTCIAVLDRRPGEEIRREIEECLKQIDLNGSTVVVRHGDGFLENSLRKVAAASAKSVIIQNDPSVPKLQSDVVAMQKVLALRGQGWPECGHIVVHVAEKANEQLFKNLAADAIRVVILESLVADAMVLCSRYPGLGNVLEQSFGFEGDEFYVERLPGLTGKTFQDAVFSFADAIAVGVVTAKGQCLLSPSHDHVIRADEKIIVYAEDDDSYHLAETCVVDFPMWLQHSFLQFSPGETLTRPRQTATKRYLILGWNSNAAYLLNKLAAFSKCTVLSERPVDTRMQDLADFDKHSEVVQFRAANIEHRLGCPAAHSDLKTLNFIDYDSIFILADPASSGRGSAWERPARLAADGSTTASILIIRGILSQSAAAERKPPCIVPQILEASTAVILEELGVRDYIDSSRLVSSFLAAVSEGPEVQSVIEGLASSDHRSFHIRPLQYYLPPSTKAPRELSFWDAVCFVRRCSDDVVVGWSRPRVGEKDEAQWVLNPRDKHEKVVWSTDDELVIIGP